MSAESNLVNVGRITAVYGVKGWVKVHSYTDPQENLFEYHPWFLKTKHGVKKIEIDDARPHGDAFVAHIVGIDDRDLAAQYTAADECLARAGPAVVYSAAGRVPGFSMEVARLAFTGRAGETILLL
jgi:16S rRNA processing protein RimM